MISVALALTQLRYTEVPAVRTVLPNDSIIFVQSMPGKTVAVSFLIGCANLSDVPASYGYRHLLEHIIARSVPGHDVEIETAGGTLDASTARDWMRFDWQVPPSSLPVVLGAIRKFLDWKGASAEEIARESRLIGLERSLLENDQLESIAAWRDVFGDAGLDPVGTEESCAGATPEQLKTLWKNLTVGQNVVVSVAGPVDKDAVTADLRSICIGLGKRGQKVWPSRTLKGDFGSGRSVGMILPAVGAPNWGAGIIAAFAVSSRLDQPYVSLSASARPSVALVGSDKPPASLRALMAAEDPADSFARGKAYAQRWILGQIGSPMRSAAFHGLLLNVGPSRTPKKLWEDISFADYQEFLRQWRQAVAVAK